jgi:hypothetical protein
MKNEPWRWALGLLSAAFIVYLWSSKDVAGIYADLPREELLPLIVTNAAVTLLKVALIAAAVWLLRWLSTKWNKRDK